MILRGLLIVFIIGILTGCATTSTTPLGTYYPKKISDLETIKSLIESRNRTIESHPQWRMIASQRIMPRSLYDIPRNEYESFREYLDDGIMYIIVHPAYYFFFHDGSLFAETKDIEAYLYRDIYTKRELFLREQERALRDFLEITSTRNRLILIILPGNYREYSGFKYRYGDDEFARYINEVTNNSDATIYLYSEKPNRGMLSSESLNALLDFIKAVNPDSIVLGGGYLGRCLEDFYRQLSSTMKEGKIAIEPWISALSPEDLKYFDINDLIKEDKLDMSLMKDLHKNYSKANNSFKEILKNYKNNKGRS